MFYQLNKILLFILLVAFNCFGATLLGAYNAYRAGSYEQSLTDYKQVYESTNNRDALYGVINSLVALAQYDEALTFCKTDTDPILQAKELWIYGLQNDRRSAQSFSEMEHSHSDSSNAMICRSAGIGFAENGNYREAIKWYESANRFVSEPFTDELLEYAIQAKKDAVIWSGTVLGGPIVYSQDEINDMGLTYSYDKGSFFDIGSHWNIKNKHSFELIYSRFNASFQGGFTDYFYGINYESSLYHSLDDDAGWEWTTEYSVNDSLTAWQNSNSESNKYAQTTLDSIRDTVTGTVYDPDTLFSLYEEHYLGTSDTGIYDTITSITTEDEKPSPLYQNNLYLGYVRNFAGGRNFHWGTAVNLLSSNIYGMKSGATLYGYHGHPIRKVELNGHWYATITDEISMLQLSPEFLGHFGKLSLRVTPAYAWKRDAPDIFNIPGIQLSCESELKFHTNSVTVGGMATVGKRAFVAEKAAKHTVTITLPHTFTGSLSLAVHPGRQRVTVFTVLRYENYEQLSRLIALGGLTVSI